MTRVFTNGCFDILHAGHIHLLKSAKELGNILIVGINTDQSVQRIKGIARPFMNLQERMDVLSAVRYVDAVIPFDEDTPETLIRALKPDLIVKGDEWLSVPIPWADVAPTTFISHLPNNSTSELARRIVKPVLR